jgi:hypothetical protein
MVCVHARDAFTRVCKCVVDIVLDMYSYTFMKTSHYKAMLSTVIKDLQAAWDRRERLTDQLLEVNAKLDSLRDTAYSVSHLCEADPEKEFPHLFERESPQDKGITDAIRKLFTPGLGYTAIQVRDGLRAKGFRIDHYKNPLATIHTILKRLVKSGELHAIESDDNEPTSYFRLPG